MQGVFTKELPQTSSLWNWNNTQNLSGNHKIQNTDIIFGRCLPYFLYLSNDLFLGFHNCLYLLVGNLVGAGGGKRSTYLGKKQVYLTAEIRLGFESPWILFTCPCWPGNPAPLLAISSVTAETYFLCSSRIMSSCLLSCLISRWIRFCPSKICLSSRSLTVSKTSSAAKGKAQVVLMHVHIPHPLYWIILVPLTYPHLSTFSYNFAIPKSKRLCGKGIISYQRKAELYLKNEDQNNI